MFNIKILFRLLSKGKGVPTLLLLVLGPFFIFAHPQKTFAFDNSRVIDDSIFFNKNSMTEQTIQNFLVSHGSYLANYTVPAARYETYQGVNYYEGTWVGPVGQEVDATGWSAAHLIYMDSQWYGINPMVILTTLQKESSLVTYNSSPWYGYVMWAMGYAYTESGINATCGTSTNYNPSGSCAGFAMQVDWGSGGLAQWAIWANTHDSHAGIYWTGNTVPIDGQSIYLGNGATAALYRYTPHIQTDFTNIYSSWFGSLLVQGPNIIADSSSPDPKALYLLDNNVKRYISSSEYVNWGLNKYPVNYIDSNVLNSYTTSTALTNYAADDAGAIYVIDAGSKHWVPDWAAFDIWGFNRADILHISSVTLGYLPNGMNFSYLVKGPDPSTDIYLVDNGVKHHILVSGLLGHLGFPARNICIISSDLLNTLSAGSDFGSFLIKGSGVDEFVLDQGRKRYIPSTTVFNDWKFDASTINTLNDSTMQELPSGNNLSNLAEQEGSPGIYLIGNGSKHLINNYNTFLNWGFNQNDVFTISYSPILSVLSTSPTLTRLPNSTIDGKIYLVTNGSKQWIDSPETFNFYGFHWDEVSDASSDTLSLLANGSDITLPQLVAHSYGGAVYFIENHEKRAINSSDTFNNWGFNWNNILFTPNDAYLDGYSNGYLVTKLARDPSSGKIYLIESGAKCYIPTITIFNEHGYNWYDVYDSDPATLNALPNGADVS